MEEKSRSTAAQLKEAIGESHTNQSHQHLHPQYSCVHHVVMANRVEPYAYSANVSVKGAIRVCRTYTQPAQSIATRVRSRLSHH